ncbi:MAG: 6-phosphogluconolactonase [Polyangiaceae bacterium]
MAFARRPESTVVGEIVTLADASSLAERAAELMRAAITAAIQERGVAMIALSGGSTPGPAYRLLARSALDFARCRWFFVDERCVPRRTRPGATTARPCTICSSLRGWT